MGTPRRKRVYTPALLENLRFRFEETEESIVDIAASVPISHTTLRLLARERGWTKYQPPPLDLTPAARLAAEAEKLAADAERLAGFASRRDEDGASSTLPPRSGGEAGREAPVEIEKTEAAARASPPTPDTPSLCFGGQDPSPPLASLMGGGEENAVTPSDLPLAGGGEEESAERTGGGEENVADADLSNIARGAREARISGLMRMLDMQIAKLRQKQALPQREHEMKAINAELNKLLAGHSHLEHRLDELKFGRPIPTPRNDDDDIPKDIDAFRLRLAAKIEAFLERRPDLGDGDEDAGRGRGPAGA